jgi:hypothetical protein
MSPALACFNRLMHPFDDPHISPGEVADYLAQPLIKPFPMHTPFINLPNTSAPVSRPQHIGTVHCINVARLGQPQALRWFGISAICGASGNAHTTQSQAEQDLLDWADGKPVGYVQHAVVPLSEMARYAPMVAAGVAADRRRAQPRPYALAGLALLSATLYLVSRIRS